jgi:hypothetical protein
MSNSVTSYGTFTFNIDGEAVPASLTLPSTTINSTNMINVIMTINTGSLTALYTGSLTTLRYAYFSNATSGSASNSIFILPASNAAVTSTTPVLQQALTVGQQGDFALISTSGSVAPLQYWAGSSGSNGTLTYILVGQ